MKTEKRVTKILGLSLLAALGVIAVTAAVAQAGEFRVGGKTFAEAGVAEEAAGGNGGSLTLSVSSGLTLSCSTVHYSKVTWLKGGDTDADSVTALGCSVAENETCTIYPTEEDAENNTNSKVITGSAKGHLVLHGSPIVHYIELVGAGAEKLLMTVYFGGEECALSGEAKITGSTAVEMPSALKELVKQPLKSVSAETAKLLGVQLFYGKETASLSGNESSVELTGANAGKQWGAE